MKKNVALSVMALASALALCAGFTAADETPTTRSRILPASLNELYPPRAQGPIYLVAMHELNTSLAGMMCDLFEDDIDNAKQNEEKFKAAYRRAAGLVPEWESQYPQEPLADLEAAIESGKRDQVMAAMTQIDRVCHGCHVEYMPAVQFKYHWTDFETISVTDPVSGQETGFRQFKQMLNTDLAGIGNDLAQGQAEHAKKHAAAFASRFDELAGLCEACHDTKRNYFVSADVRALIDTLRLVLDDVSPDASKTGAVAQRIGLESCSKCHLVHVPGAYSKY